MPRLTCCFIGTHVDAGVVFTGTKRGRDAMAALEAEADTIGVPAGGKPAPLKGFVSGG